MKFTKVQKLARRRARVRARISGTATRPRLSVSRSLRGVYLQLIDDNAGKTLLSVNSKKDLDTSIDAGERAGKIKDAYVLGAVLGKKAQEKGITSIVFDRAGHKYHGRVKAIAEGARAEGLTF